MARQPADSVARLERAAEDHRRLEPRRRRVAIARAVREARHRSRRTSTCRSSSRRTAGSTCAAISARRAASPSNSTPDGGDSNFEFRRAALRFGGAAPEFRTESGITFDGSVGALDVDAWLALPSAPAGTASTTDWAGAFAGAELESTDLTAFAQKLGATKVSARRRTDDWQIELDSEPIAGTLLVPLDLTAKPQVIAVMRRLFLNGGGEGSTRASTRAICRGCSCTPTRSVSVSASSGASTPRSCPIRSGCGSCRSRARPRASALKAAAPGSSGDNGDTTRFAVSLTSTNVAKTLDQLGFDPIIEAQGLDATASVHWPGPPTGDWMAHRRRRRVAARDEGQPARRGAGCGTHDRALELRHAAPTSDSRLSRRVQQGPRVRRHQGRFRGDRRQRVHGQLEAHGAGRRNRRDRPHGLARPRLSSAGRRHGRAEQHAADGRFARRTRGRGGAPDLHAALQGAAEGPRPRLVLRERHLAGAVGRAPDAPSSSGRVQICAELPPGAPRRPPRAERTNGSRSDEGSRHPDDQHARRARESRRGRAPARRSRRARRELAVLPENFSFMGATEAEKIAAVERDGDGAAQAFPRGTSGEARAVHRRRHDPHSRRGRRAGRCALVALRPRRPRGRCATTRSICSTSTFRAARRSAISNPRARAPGTRRRDGELCLRLGSA